MNQLRNSNQVDEGSSAADNRSRAERVSDGSLAGRKYPITLERTIIPIPALMALKPQTHGTDSLIYRSDGWGTFAIVVKRAYGLPDGCRTRRKFLRVKSRSMGRVNWLLAL